MFIISAVKLILFISIFIFFGWQFTRRALKQNELFIVVPTAYIGGLAGYVILVNFLGYIIDIRLAFWAGLFILLAAGLGLLAIRSKKIIAGLEKKHIFYLSLITLAFILFFAPIFLTNHAYDEAYHGPLISTIAHGNFPVMSYFTPDRWAQYHYAFNLMAAALSVVAGVPTHISSIIGMVLVLAPVFWMAFVLIFKLTKSLAAGYITAWLIFFGGGLRYFTVLRDLPWGENRFLWDYLGQIVNKFSQTAALGPGYFHPYSVDTFAATLYHRPMFFSLPIMIFLLWLIYLEQKRGGLACRLSLGITFGFLALAAETTFVILAAGWGIWKLILLWKDKSQRMVSAKNIFLVGILAGATAILQGGVITDFFFHNQDEIALTSYTAFELRRIPGLLAYDKFFPFNEIYSWFFFIIEWGLPLLVLPVAAYRALKKGGIFYNLFLIIIAVGFLTTFFVSYPVSPGEMVRVNSIVLFFMLLVLGNFLGKFWARGGFKKALVVSALVLMGVSPLLFNLRAFPARLFIKPMLLGEVDRSKEKEMAEAAAGLVPDKAVVLTAAPLAVTQLWGRRAFFGSYDFETNDINIALPRLLDKNDLPHIKGRGAEYLYLNPSFAGYGGDVFVEKNKDRLELIYLLPAGGYELYKIL